MRTETGSTWSVRNAVLAVSVHLAPLYRCWKWDLGCSMDLAVSG